MTPFSKTVKWLWIAAPLVLGSLVVSGCDDAFDFDWILQVDTAVVYSLSRPEYLDRASAYDFGPGGGPRVVEVPAATPVRWDLAFAEEDGDFVALPAGLFQGFDIDPGVQEITGGVSFDALDLAPRDGYVTSESFPLREGGLYVVKSRRDFRRCNHYAKFEVLRLDPIGIIEFQSVENPLCNDRELIPEDQQD